MLPGWGNARDCIGLWRKILSERANRVVDKLEIPKTIIRSDIEAALSGIIKDRTPGSGDDSSCNNNLDANPFAPLNELYRIDNIKGMLKNLRNEFEVAKQEGSDTPVLGHFIFRGSPGTGKTTVARCMAQIFRKLGLIRRIHVEETSGLNLTGEYVGHTKKKVQDVLAASRGGVLFIDEAYELGKGHFSDEALTTLVAAMTDPTYKGLVVIIAGYAKEIDAMLNVNPGLKSRFQRSVDFDDWNSQDCWKFLNKMGEKESYRLDENLFGLVVDKIDELRMLPGWGNARDCITLWRKILSERANRVVGKLENKKSIIRSDIEGALFDMIKDRAPRPVYDSLKPQKVQVMPGPKPRESDHSMIPRKGQMVQQHWGEKAEARTECQQEIQSNKQAEEYTRVEQQKSEEKDAEDEMYEESVDGALRDPDVAEEIWRELEEAKRRAMEEEKERKRQEDEERRRYENEVADFKEKLKEEKEKETRKEYKLEIKQRDKAKKKQEDNSRKREELERRQKERLRHLCPAGYKWYQCGGGWRCGGGSHFVSDAELNKWFMSDA